jgi:hypothetical protein
MGKPFAMCPIRIGEACSLCVPGASGPENCALVAEVMRDPELRAQLAELRREYLAEHHRIGAA